MTPTESIRHIVLSSKQCLPVALAAAVVFMAPFPAMATDYGSGNYWLEVCTSQAAEKKGRCLGYVTGLTDGIAMMAKLPEVHKFYCAPTGVTFGQVEDIFVKALKSDPKNRHLRGDNLFLASMVEAFPCR